MEAVEVEEKLAEIQRLLAKATKVTDSIKVSKNLDEYEPGGEDDIHCEIVGYVVFDQMGLKLNYLEELALTEFLRRHVFPDSLILLKDNWPQKDSKQMRVHQLSYFGVRYAHLSNSEENYFIDRKNNKIDWTKISSISSPAEFKQSWLEYMTAEKRSDKKRIEILTYLMGQVFIAAVEGKLKLKEKSISMNASFRV
jgi:hypothetical protein